MKGLFQPFPFYPHIRSDKLLTNLLLRSKFWRRYIAPRKFRSFDSTAKMDTRINVQYANNISIGKKVKIQNGSYLIAGASENESIVIEDFALISKDINILTASYVVSDQFDTLIRDVPAKRGSVLIRSGAFIGYGSYIMPGVEIGEKAIIPPYSIVTENVPSKTIWKPTNNSPIAR